MKLKLYLKKFIEIYKEQTKDFTIYQKLFGINYMGLNLLLFFLLILLMLILK
jgi:hypothetical protein